jgi:hypothetical protein
MKFEYLILNPSNVRDQRILKVHKYVDLNMFMVVYLERQPGNTNEINEYNKKDTKIKKQSIKYCMKTEHSSKKREIRKWETNV